MKNVEYEVKDGKLHITVDLVKEFGKSKSGKSTTVASTEGNPEITEGIYMGLNVYKK